MSTIHLVLRAGEKENSYIKKRGQTVIGRNISDEQGQFLRAEKKISDRQEPPQVDQGQCFMIWDNLGRVGTISDDQEQSLMGWNNF